MSLENLYKKIGTFSVVILFTIWLGFSFAGRAFASELFINPSSNTASVQATALTPTNTYKVNVKSASIFTPIYMISLEFKAQNDGTGVVSFVGLIPGGQYVADLVDDSSSVIKQIFFMTHGGTVFYQAQSGPWTPEQLQPWADAVAVADILSVDNNSPTYNSVALKINFNSRGKVISGITIPDGVIVPGVAIPGTAIPSIEIIWAKVSGNTVTDQKSSGAINQPFGVLPPSASIASYNYTISDLAPNTTYNYRVKYNTSIFGNFSSSIHTFKTTNSYIAVAPKITISTSDITTTTANINVGLDQINDPAAFPLRLELLYGKIGQPTKVQTIDTENLTMSDLPKKLVVALGMLEPNSTYTYYVSKFGNSINTRFSGTEMFTTLSGSNTTSTTSSTATTQTDNTSSSPLVSGAQKLVKKINNLIINPLIALMFAVAFAYFIWGVVEYVLKGSSDEARSRGKQHMLWGIIGIFVMISVFGIMQLLINTLGVTGVNPRG